MFSGDYSDIALDHFMCPRNSGVISDYNGEGTNGDTDCGDYIEVYIRSEKNIIQDISYMVYGCPASVATSSMTSQHAKGKTLEEALKISEEDIIEALGGLPENKKHCSNLDVKALRNAIDNFYENAKK